MIYFVLLFSLFACTIFETLQTNAPLKDKIQTVSQYTKCNRIFDFTIYLLLVIIMTLMSALRGELGTDWFIYKQNFEILLNNPSKIGSIKSGVEIGYQAINLLFTKFTNNYFILQLYLSIFTCFVIFKNFWKSSFSPFLLLYVYYTSDYLGINFEFLRQGVAIAIVIIGLKFIREKKIIWWTLIIILAMQFHITALVAFPLYFTTYKKISKKMAILLLIVALFITFLGNVFIRTFILFLSKLSFLPERVIYLLQTYILVSSKHGKIVKFGSGYGFFVRYVIYIYIIFLCFKGKNKSKDFFVFNLLINIVIIAIGRNIEVLGRCALYYLISGNGIFAYSIICERDRNFYKNLDFIRLAFVFLFVLFSSLTFYSGFKTVRPSGKSNADYYIPYKTFLEVM